MSTNVATGGAEGQAVNNEGYNTAGTHNQPGYTTMNTAANNQGTHTNGHHHHGHTGGILPRHQGTVSQVTDPQYFSVGNPGPLGLLGFAVTTFVLGLYQIGAGLPHANALGSVGPDQAVFGLAVFFGGAAQFIAGIMEFRVGNTFGTTVHCSYGAFWLSFAMFLVPTLGIQSAYAGDMHAYSVAVGIFLFVWFILTVLFFVAALRTNIAILVVLGFLALAFFFLSIAQFISTTHATAATRVNRAGGVFAFICSLAALYAGASGIMTPATTWVRFPLGEFSTEPVASSKSAA